MRHTFTFSVSVEADTANRPTVLDALLQHITDLQEQRFHSCEVLPGGREVCPRDCTLSVEYAEADEARSTAGWAVP
jgi:hypothetical protein